VEDADIKDVAEFGVNGKLRYVRDIVQIDRASSELDDLNYYRNPDFKAELLFLKVLIQGQASLYLYEDTSLKRFFYQLGDADIQQLIYKKYLVGEGQIKENNTFRNQLSSVLDCTDMKSGIIQKLRYRLSDLADIFQEYNNCSGALSQSYVPEKSKQVLNIYLRPGINYTSLKTNLLISNSILLEYDAQPEFRFGVELEFILPFNKGKWAATIEPTYHTFQDQVVQDFTFTRREYLTKYRIIEIPLGMRHYFFLSDDSKLFLDAQVFATIDLDSQIFRDGVPIFPLGSNLNLV